MEGCRDWKRWITTEVLGLDDDDDDDDEDDDDIDDDEDDDGIDDGGGDGDIGRWKLSSTGCKYAITPQAGDYTPSTKQLRGGKFQTISNLPTEKHFLLMSFSSFLWEQVFQWTRDPWVQHLLSSLG